MTSADAKLRAATERTAAEFRESDLSPLRLDAATHHDAQGLHTARLNRADGVGGADGADGAGEPRLRRGVAAFGAAAALLAILAGSLALAGYLRHRTDTSRQGDIATAMVTSGPLAGIPRYFVELPQDPTPEGLARRANVVDSVTGRILDSIAVPAPYLSFQAVAAAADDRTFVLGAERWPYTRKNAITSIRTKLFALRIGLRRSGRLTADLAPIDLKIPVNWQGQGLALSPDGTKLAFAASPFTVAVATRIWVYSMRTGTVRSWQDHGEIGRSPWDARSLSWSSDDRTLAYFWETSGNFDLLNTTLAGGSLLSHSRKLIGFASAPTPTWDADLTPDGSKVIASVDVPSGGRIDEFSATSGQLIRAVRPAGLSRTRLYDVLWINSSGTLMIVEVYADSRDSHAVLLLRGTKLTPVTGVRGVINRADFVAW